MTQLVQRLGYIALGVQDLDGAAEDAQNIAGARLIEKTASRAILSANQRFAELILHKSAENAVRCIGLEAINADAVEEVARRAKEAGLTILTRKPSLDVIDVAVTFMTSEGHVIEVHTAMPESNPRRYLGPGIHPNYLDHVNVTASDPQQFALEINTATGMLLSERTTGYEVMWMRAGDNRHHTLAAVKSKPGLHHYSWEFFAFEDFKRLADTLDADDRVLIWGPGRHGAGDNLFTYYFDRSGFMVECIAEMEVIQDENFEPRVSEPGENLSNIKVVNRWGAPPPIEWIEHRNPFAKPDWLTEEDSLAVAQ